jgi:hypothetical protein
MINSFFFPYVMIWFSIIHHYLQDDVEKVAINLLEYFAKYGYLLTRNRVQIFNHAFLYLATNRHLATNRNSWKNTVWLRSAEAKYGTTWQNFTRFLFTANPCDKRYRGWVPLWLRFCGGPRVPRESDGGFLRIICSLPTPLTTLVVIFSQQLISEGIFRLPITFRAN